jgi:hypothetical protein
MAGRMLGCVAFTIRYSLPRGAWWSLHLPGHPLAQRRGLDDLASAQAIRIVTGGRAKVELSPYDLTRGRITYRDK